MKKEVLMIRTPANEPVCTLGVRLDEHFAWTRPPAVSVNGEYVAPDYGAAPFILTHIPTGGSLAAPVTKREAAELVKHLRALPGVPWGAATPEELVAALCQAVAPKDPRLWLDDLLRSLRDDAKKNPDLSRLEKLLATKEWRGSTVTVEKHALAERQGDCRAANCKREHMLAIVKKRGRGRITEVWERRHAELVECHKIVHPRGAIAWLRKDT